MEEERAAFQSERAGRTQRLMEAQATEQREFDLQSATMGLDAMHIAETTQVWYYFDIQTTHNTESQINGLYNIIKSLQKTWYQIK